MALSLCNLGTAQGCGGFGNFFMIWAGLAILVLIGAIAKKWLGEEEVLSFPYNWIGSLLGPVAYIITGVLTKSAKISLVVGLIGLLFGGFAMGAVSGGTSE